MPQFKNRLHILFLAVLIVSVLFLGRLAQMQILWRDRFSQDYETPTSGDELINTVRGSIYSASGEVIARDAPRYDLSIYYPRLKEPDDWLPVVSSLTETPESELEERRHDIIRRVERIWRRVKERTGLENLRILEQQRYHPVVQDVSSEIAAAVRTNRVGCPNLKVTIGSQRIYLSSTPIPHIIGRLSRISAKQWDDLSERDETWTTDMPVSDVGKRYKMNDMIGVSGIEKFYEKELRGRRGYIIHRLEFNPLEVKKVEDITEPGPGLNVHLTLRLDFQRAVNRALQWAQNNPGMDFDSGAVVILNVRDGGVLAAATWPTYDRPTYRNNFKSLADNQLSPLLFRPTQAALPTGSIFKLITAIAALEDDTITADTSFTCNHRKKIKNRWFHCVGYHGPIQLIEAIERSCNIYFFSTAERLDGSVLQEWGKRFGMGVRSHFDLPYTNSGFIPEPNSLFDKLNLSIGQGRLLCNPLQVARACAAVANGGRLIKPHLLQHFTDSQGKRIDTSKAEAGRIKVDGKTLDLVRRGMYRVVNGSGGTARKSGLRRFQAAGKSGTAELGPGQPNHAWFAGFAPYKNPKIAFAVVNERTSGHGGSHAAPIIAKALEQIWPEVQELPSGLNHPPENQ